MEDSVAANGTPNGTAGAEAGGADGGGEEPLPDPSPDRPFSWLDAHPIFVILLVGPEEKPFGIQKDFLCARSSFYRKHFEVGDKAEAIEYIVRLPDTPIAVFAHAQNFLFTGEVFSDDDSVPSYDALVGVWKLGHDLGIEGLCDRALEAMGECRRVTQHIPATPLLVQAWRDTPEGSTIRELLLTWAAEYMRSSDSRTEFARSLPQEVLSELVVAMSSLDATPAAVRVNSPAPPQHKSVHYLELKDNGDVVPIAKKQRYSDVLPNGHAGPKAAAAKKPARASLPAPKPAIKRRSNVTSLDPVQFSTDQKLNFCADLLTRMLSGPGFWTRLVGPFREPVDPFSDGVPDYLERIKKPMDLGTMKAKMDRKEYVDDENFLDDMRQIFHNCYTYWNRGDPMWAACEKLEKTFEEKYGQMNKWIAKMSGDEGA